jgi:hypothetical protein
MRRKVPDGLARNRYYGRNIGLEQRARLARAPIAGDTERFG